MDLEEFESFFDKLDQELELVKQRQNAFIKDVETQIINHSIIFFPEYAADKPRIEKRLRKELHENVVTINETLDYLLPNENKNESPNPTENIVPQKHKFERAELELENALSQSTPPHSQEYIQEMKDCIDEQRTKREFLFYIHNQIMELTFIHFPEIIELNGNSIRRINYLSYITAMQHTEGFYYLITN